MKLPPELLLLIPSALSAALVPRSATLPHLAGLTHLTRDFSTSDPRTPSKYFHEFVYHPHYDGRFAASVLPHKTRALHMRLLLRTYMTAMERIGVQTWLMHGSLLGWWWNRSMFPWDSDLDFCIEEEGVEELGTWWNMTVHSFSARELGLAIDDDEHAHGWSRARQSSGSEKDTMPSMSEPEGLEAGVWTRVLEEGKKYLLEVNPHYTDPSTSDKDNVIDARWIDTATGLFIDITTVHPVPLSASAKSAEKHMIFPGQVQGYTREGKGENEHEPSRGAKEMYTKDTHLYTTSSLFPLRQSIFEGTRVYVPYAYEQLLLEEYGPRALIETQFGNYEFDRNTKEWAVTSTDGSTRKSDMEKDSGKGDAAGRFSKTGVKPERKHVKAEERTVRNNAGEKVYIPSPGSTGDVHIVPGGTS